MDVKSKSTEAENIFQILCRVVQMMSLALERRKASRNQMRDWAAMLRRAADDLERKADAT